MAPTYQTSRSPLRSITRYFRSTCWLLLATGLTMLIGQQAVAADRFVGMLADGKPIQGKQIHDWYNDKSKPRLDDQALLDENNPVSWLRDRDAPQATAPPAYVELVCGDRLPGRVREYRQGDEQANLTLPPHVVVVPGFEQRPERDDPNMTIRVEAKQLRRIVWQARSREAYQPNELFLRDGSSIRYRAVRFGSSSVALLTEAGPQRYSFGEIAELHMPQKNAWDAHFDELSVLEEGEEARLMQVETSDGLLATSSLSRMVVMGHGGPDRYDFWIHAIQPGWSLDPLWVPCGNIVVRRFFAMNEMPLSRLQVKRSTHGSAFGAESLVKRNANVLEGLQRSGDYEAGWGFGVQGAGEIVLALHKAVRSLRGRVGLDQAVGAGGCIRAEAYVGSSESPEWKSSTIVGSEKSVSLGTIGIDPLDDEEQPRDLRLAINDAHKDRPDGADPWEIRDLANWMDPRLVLDEGMVREELQQRFPQQIAAWGDWHLVEEEDDILQAVSYWSSIHPPMGEYRTLTQIKEDQTLRLTSTIALTEKTNWLVVLAVHRNHTDPGSMIEVRIGGDLAGTYEAPLMDPSHRDPKPLVVPLADYRAGGTQQIEVEIISHHASKPLDWQAISVVEDMPLLATLFEDQGRFENQEAEAPVVEAELETVDRHSGNSSVKVAAGQSIHVTFPQAAEIRNSPQWGQYRYLRFAFRKKGGGRVGIELDRPPAEEQPARYDAGQGEPVGEEAKRVWTLELPDEWIVMSRNIASEFGDFNTEGMTLTVPDGDYALFDHVYLARSEQDFDYAADALSPEQVNQKARRELAAEVLERALPKVVKLEMPDGRTGTGTIVTPDGYVITAGHLLVKADQEVKVFLSDGRELQGTSLGIDRASDCGLLKIEKQEESLPELEIRSTDDLDQKQLHLGAIYAPEAVATEEPLTHIAGIRRIVDGVIWTDFDAAQWTAGGPLLDREARVVGLLTSRSRYGGFQYVIGERIEKNIERMKRKEVWGEWQSGSGPMVGLVIRTLSDGCRVIDVIPDSPAAEAGLQVDDYVTAIDGKAVASLGEIYSQLKEKNPGDKVKVDYVRGDDQRETDMTLTPRWP